MHIYTLRGARMLQSVKTVTFAERESCKNEYLYASLSAKAAVMHIYTLRGARKLQSVKIVTFAECECSKNE
jgi:predicted HAD superfamily hydrolase